jgi:magnesium-transporting ATPase (P-type)
MSINQVASKRRRRGGPLLSVGDIARQVAETRSGAPRQLAARDLLPGDVITLTPADCGCRWVVTAVREVEEDCSVVNVASADGSHETWFSDRPDSLINLVGGPRVDTREDGDVE